MKNYFKKFISRDFRKKIIHKSEYSSIVDINDKFKKKILFYINGGDLNPDKVFYVIKRFPGTGIFSNLAFVINHMRLAYSMNFIPIVDMKNYPSVYNEKKKIFGTYNSWKYYFDQISNYSLEEVYKSKNIILTDNRFYKEKEFNYRITSSDALLQIFHEKIKIKKVKLKTIEYLKNKIFGNKKILGVHHRGTSYKVTSYPITINQMINIINDILKKDNYDKVFLVTEDKNNFNALLNYFGNKIICLENSQRGKTSLEVWKNYPRSRHRYKLGRDILYETYLLSCCDGYFDIDTNPRQFVHALNLNKKQKRYTFDNGFRKRWSLFEYLDFSWYIKKNLPENLGGFKKNKKPTKYNGEK